MSPFDRLACGDRRVVPYGSVLAEPSFGPSELRQALRIVFAQDDQVYWFIHAEDAPSSLLACRAAFGPDCLLAVHPAQLERGRNTPELLLANLPAPETAGYVSCASVPVEAAGVRGLLVLAFVRGPIQLPEGWRSTVSACAAQALVAARRASLEHPRLRSQHVLATIYSELRRGAHLPDVARRMNLSPSRCSHLVRELFGCSFSTLRDQLRVQRARELLLDQGCKVAAVADEIGIADPCYFHRFFKRRTGTTPLEFRSRHRAARWATGDGLPHEGRGVHLVPPSHDAGESTPA